MASKTFVTSQVFATTININPYLYVFFAHDVAIGIEDGVGLLRDAGAILDMDHGATLVADGIAIRIEVGPTNGNLSEISLGTGALIRSMTDTAIQLSGIGAKIVNAGTIRGTTSGISLDAILDYDPDSIATIVNSGAIKSLGPAIRRASAADTEPIYITNSGTIESLTSFTKVSFSSAGATAVDRITNTGKMVGSINMDGGADFIDTKSGSVQGTIDLGAGKDTAYGSAAADTIFGGDDSDIIRGGGGKDSLDGGGGADYLDYRDKSVAVQVTLNGSTVSTVLVNGTAEDKVVNFERVYGGSASDKLTGNGTANSLYGENGNDALVGGAGADTLSGGNGNDTVIGGTGKDSLSGGAGADQFRFVDAANAANLDSITDFVHGTDKIVLENAIFAALGTSVTSDEFVAKASGHAATTTSQHLIYDKSAGTLWYDADGNKSGGAVAVQIAQLGTSAAHPTNLTYSDFGIV